MTSFNFFPDLTLSFYSVISYWKRSNIHKRKCFPRFKVLGLRSGLGHRLVYLTKPMGFSILNAFVSPYHYWVFLRVNYSDVCQEKCH